MKYIILLLSLIIFSSSCSSYTKKYNNRIFYGEEWISLPNGKMMKKTKYDKQEIKMIKKTIKKMSKDEKILFFETRIDTFHMDN